MQPGRHRKGARRLLGHHQVRERDILLKLINESEDIPKRREVEYQVEQWDLKVELSEDVVMKRGQRGALSAGLSELEIEPKINQNLSKFEYLISNIF